MAAEPLSELELLDVLATALDRLRQDLDHLEKFTSILSGDERRIAEAIRSDLKTHAFGIAMSAWLLSRDAAWDRAEASGDDIGPMLLH